MTPETTPDRIDVLEAALRRSRVVAGLPSDRPPDAEDGPLSALLLCKAGRLGRVAATCGREVALLCALNGTVAIDCLLARDFDGLVVDVESIGHEAADIIAHVRRHGALSDLPVIAIVRHGEGANLVTAGADAAVALEGLAAELAGRAHRARRLRALKEALRSIKRRRMATTSGMPGQAVFEAHVRVAHDLREPRVVLAGLTTRMIGGESLPPVVTRTLGAVLASVTRAEDVACEIGPGRFGLVFAGADPAHGERVATRLAGIVAQSLVPGPDGEGHRLTVHSLVNPLAALMPGSALTALFTTGAVP